MASGESEAAVRGAASAIAATGRDAASSMARLTEEAAAAQERIVADVEGADREAAARVAAASGRGRFPVAPGVPGPAKNKVLTAPNKRHTVTGAKTGEVKGDNTVTLRGFESVLRADTERIAAGGAAFNSELGVYEVDGRTYGVKGEGTVFPISGPGLVKLDRTEYAALQLLLRSKGDVDSVAQFRHAPRFRDNPELIARVKAIYDGTYAL